MTIMGMEINGLEAVAKATKSIKRRQSMELYYNINTGEAFIGENEKTSCELAKITNIIAPCTEANLAKYIVRYMMA